MFALEQVGNAAGEFKDVDATVHLALGVGEDLAVFGNNDARQVVLAFTQQVQVLEQYAGTADRRCVSPAGERGLGGSDGFAHGLAAGQGDAGGHVTGGRVVDVLIAIIAAHALIVDVVFDRCSHGRGPLVGNVGTHDRLSVCSKPEQNPELIVLTGEQ